MVVYLFLCLFFFSVSETLRNIAYPYLLENFQISSILAGIFFTLPTLLNIFVGKTLFYWVKKIKIKNFLPLCLLLVGFGILCFLYSFFIKPSFILILFSTFFWGLGIGGIFFMIHILLPYSVKNTSFSYNKISSLFQSTFALGSLLVPLTLTVINSQWWILLLALSFCYFVLVFPLFKSSFDYSQIQVSKGSTWLTTTKTKYLVSSILGLAITSEVLIASRMPLFFTMNGYSSQQINLCVFAFFSLMLLGRILGSFIKLSPSQVIRFLWGTSLFSLSFILLGIFVHPFFFPATGIFISLFFPYFVSWIQETFKSEQEAAITYCLFTMSLFLLIGHFLMSVLVEFFGSYSILLVALAYIVNLVLLFILIQKKEYNGKRN